jgi:hypothetical protein
VASSLGLRLVGTERIIGVTGTAATVPLVEVIGVGVGQMELPPFQAGILDLGPLRLGIQAILGSMPLQDVVSRSISQKDACICCTKRVEWTCSCP